jgi:hypothetical protein
MYFSPSCFDGFFLKNNRCEMFSSASLFTTQAPMSTLLLIGRHSRVDIGDSAELSQNQNKTITNPRSKFKPSLSKIQDSRPLGLEIEPSDTIQSVKAKEIIEQVKTIAPKAPTFGLCWSPTQGRSFKTVLIIELKEKT